MTSFEVLEKIDLFNKSIKTSYKGVKNIYNYDTVIKIWLFNVNDINKIQGRLIFLKRNPLFIDEYYGKSWF